MLLVNRVIKGQFQFYKGIKGNDHLWSFSFNSFVKFHGKKIASHNCKICVIMRCVIKGLQSDYFKLTAQCYLLVCIMVNLFFQSIVYCLLGDDAGHMGLA